MFFVLSSSIQWAHVILCFNCFGLKKYAEDDAMILFSAKNLTSVGIIENIALKYTQLSLFSLISELHFQKHLWKII